MCVAVTVRVSLLVICTAYPAALQLSALCNPGDAGRSTSDGRNCERPSARAELRLRLGAPGVQDRLGVAAGLGAALEDEVAGGLEGSGAVETRPHGAVMRIAGILAIHHGRHAPQ